MFEYKVCIFYFNEVINKIFGYYVFDYVVNLFLNLYLMLI